MTGELSERWWESSAQYRETGHWLTAHASFRKGDNRVLLLGPGHKNPLHGVTSDLKAFLERVGFQAATLDGDFDPHEHRAQAADYPRIVALPVTVGSCSEVLDFAADEDLRARLAVVLPREHHSGYFARILREDRGLKVSECGAVDATTEIDAELGKKCLMALAARENRLSSASQAASMTAAARGPENVQAREAGIATQTGDELVPAPPRTLTRVVGGFALAVIGAVVALAVAGISAGTIAVVGVILLIVFFGLQPILLRQVGLISEASLVKMFSEVARQISSLSGSSSPQQAEPQNLPEGQSPPPGELPAGESPPPEQEG